jgi:photosystem II stability/assembly factor-like uncharacterized protein
MFRRAHSCLTAALLIVALLSGCATPTAVSTETEFQPNEGLVALRVIDLGQVPIRRFTVVSESTGQVYPLRAVRFGQTSTMTYVGRLPAGRYQPKSLLGFKQVGLEARTRTVPLDELTGKFDVEARRVTDLGTMALIEGDGKSYEYRAVGRDRYWKSEFALPLDPTPIPTEQLLAARFPQLAKAVGGKSALGWVAGTAPQHSAGSVSDARSRVRAVTQPRFVDGSTLLAGGSLGVVQQHAAAARPRSVNADTVHAIETALVLKDGRWLAGGEEGFLALSRNAGATWHRLAGLGPDEVVLHLMQTPDGRLLMVTDRDREAVVYQSAPDPIQWTVIRRIPSDREQGALTTEFGEAARFLPDFAAASRDRLVVHTRPGSLSSFDLRTGQWETHETPRSFPGGIKVTPDGYVIGIWNPAWIYGSLDYGKTWTRLEAWANMTQPHFIDHRRGVTVAAEVSLTGISPYKMRFTEDGGKTWKTGAEVGRFWDWLQPLWTDLTGATLFTISDGAIRTSNDQGKTWR